MNGVIVNDERIHQESWRQLSKKYGFKLSEEQFKHDVFGHTEVDTLDYLFKRHLSPEEQQPYLDERVKIAIDLYKPQIALPNGLLEFFNLLEQNSIPVAIATSARIPYTNFVLDSLKIRHFFTHIVTSEEIKRSKPDPEIYLLAAQKLGIDSQLCIAIEDSLSGIKSAQAAGIYVIGITSTHTREELDLANLVIDSFTELSLEKLELA